MSAIQFLIENGYGVPRFCYHGLLSIAGNCRVCVLDDREVKTSVSCALCYHLYISEHFNNGSILGIIVKNALVVREAIFEFLLLSHPLDCPICDRGGECELQDMVNSFGSDRGRTTIKKSTTVDKYFNVGISTHMSRCIVCGRCVRFLIEVGKRALLGILGRGNVSEISNFIGGVDYTENLYAQNITDLCPVSVLYYNKEYLNVWHLYIARSYTAPPSIHYIIQCRMDYDINVYYLRMYFSTPVTYSSRALVDEVYECVLCASCSASCPSVWWNSSSYLGPAVLLQSYKWIMSSQSSDIYTRLNSLNLGHNISLCHGIGNCKIVCPKNLDPAKRISSLKSLLGYDKDSLYYFN